MKDTCANIALCSPQGGYKYHQYQVVGRHLPTEKEPEPTIYRMKLWATDPVRAKSKFWCATHTPVSITSHLLLEEQLRLSACLWHGVLHHSRWLRLAWLSLRYFLRKLRKVKKMNGQILATNEVSGRLCLPVTVSCQIYHVAFLAACSSKQSQISEGHVIARRSLRRSPRQ